MKEEFLPLNTDYIEECERAIEEDKVMKYSSPIRGYGIRIYIGDEYSEKATKGFLTMLRDYFSSPLPPVKIVSEYQPYDESLEIEE